MFAIIDTKIMNSPFFAGYDESEEETCFLNHSTLHTGACGSLDMAWIGLSMADANQMLARLTAKGIDGLTIWEVSE